MLSLHPSAPFSVSSLLVGLGRMASSVYEIFSVFPAASVLLDKAQRGLNLDKNTGQVKTGSHDSF